MFQCLRLRLNHRDVGMSITGLPIVSLWRAEGVIPTTKNKEGRYQPMKAQLVGKALVITSDIKTKEIVRAQRICPEALFLMDENKDITFCVGAVVKDGDIGKYGVQFDTESTDGKAQITLMLDKAPSKDELADRYGAVFINLAAVEEKFSAEYTIAKAQLDAVIANVEGVE